MTILFSVNKYRGYTIEEYKAYPTYSAPYGVWFNVVGEEDGDRFPTLNSAKTFIKTNLPYRFFMGKHIELVENREFQNYKVDDKEFSSLQGAKEYIRTLDFINKTIKPLTH